MRKPSDLQVSSHNVLQDGTLTARLATNDCDLGKIDWVVDTDRGEHILKLVHKPARGSQLSESASSWRRGFVTNVMRAGSEMPPVVTSEPLIVLTSSQAYKLLRCLPCSTQEMGSFVSRSANSQDSNSRRRMATRDRGVGDELLSVGVRKRRRWEASWGCMRCLTARDLISIVRQGVSAA